MAIRFKLRVTCILLYICLLLDLVKLSRERENGFELLDKQNVEAGKEILKKFRTNAVKSSCWKKAVQGIETRCKSLDDVEQSYLAIEFTNCHLSKSGRKIYSCERESQSIEECTEKMDDTTYLAYTTFFTHTTNICFFVKSELWQHRTEDTISKLSRTSDDVASHLEDSAKKQLLVLEKQNKSLENQQEIISRELQLSETLRNSTLNAKRAFEDMKQNADEQKALFSETFESVFKSVEKVRKLQSMILGEFISLQSVAFYVASLCTCYFLTSTPRTAGARLPLFIGLILLIFLERLVTSWEMTDSQSTEASEIVHGRLWFCRKLFITFGSVVLMVTAYLYQDYNKINCDILRELQQQIRDIKRWQDKINGWKAITNGEPLQECLSKKSITHPSYSNHDIPADFTDACSSLHILDDYGDDDNESDYSFVPGDSELESFSDDSSDEENYENNENQESVPKVTTPVVRRQSKETTKKGSSFSSRTTRRREAPDDSSFSHKYNLRSQRNSPADINSNSFHGNLPSPSKLKEFMDNIQRRSAKRYTAVIRKPRKNTSDNTPLFSSDEES
ncbi:uncharacterized protein [Montipora capricornis]|uniref:uncharacterized protein n=1 Tax=Montipora capricornis TaxID=246305 RepID=UPI0035F17722